MGKSRWEGINNSRHCKSGKTVSGLKKSKRESLAKVKAVKPGNLMSKEQATVLVRWARTCGSDCKLLLPIIKPSPFSP